jgi:DNA-binding NarL/FixJ family response regulator
MEGIFLVRILLADDHPMMRRGLRGLLESHEGWSVVGEAADGRAAVDLAVQLKPDVVVMDIAMPGLNGLEATRQIRTQCPKAEVLVFTMVESEELVHKVLAAGARGYLLKSDIDRSVLAAVEALASHRPFFNIDISEKVLQGYLRGGGGDTAPGQKVGGDPLTPREREVVQAIAEGLSNKDLARRLGISVKTVEAHRTSVMRKIGAHSAVDVARYAARNNITFS